jgi:two-component system chemotaxis sensor kinase CheA
MDAVRSAVRGVGGDVTLTSQLGQGTTAEIRLPLTLAIVNALLVLVDGAPYAIPLDRVERTLRLADHPVRAAAGASLLVMGDAVLPILQASCELNGSAPSPSAGHAVVVRAGEERITLAVDSLVGQQELVSRALPAEIATRRAVSGGAVLSNGEIALIVDCDALVASASVRSTQVARAA